MRTKSTQVTIIGAGPAGIAAAVQLKRYGVDFVLIEKNAVGGLLRNAYRIDNYLGFPAGISGNKMVSLMSSHFNQYDIDVNFDRVLVTDYKDDKFFIQCENQLVYSDYLIIATGTEANKDNHIEIDKNAESRIFCEVADVDLTEFHNIAIVGSGDAAFDYAMTLAAENVTVSVFMRGSHSKAINRLQRMVNEKSNIKQISNAVLLNVKFNDKLKLLFNVCGKLTEFYHDALLFAIGRHANLSFLSDNLLAVANELQESGRLYLIGDVKNNIFRQASISAGDGVLTAMKLYNIIKDKT